uniref:Uncharacterized protein n=1 Tax=Romanomermis culicivorax TaxID=13658 RepID=A0A915IPU0_ROMCU
MVRQQFVQCSRFMVSQIMIRGGTMSSLVGMAMDSSTDKEMEQLFVGGRTINYEQMHISNSHFDSAIFFVNIVGDSSGGGIQLLKGVMCFKLEILDFAGISDGNATAVTMSSCLDGGWGQRWIEIDQGISGIGMVNVQVKYWKCGAMLQQQLWSGQPTRAVHSGRV